MNEKKQDVLDDLLSSPFGVDAAPTNVPLKETQSEKPRRLIDALPEENRARAIQLAEKIDRQIKRR